MTQPRQKDKAAGREWQLWVERGATFYFGACRHLAATITRMKKNRKKSDG